MQKQFFSVAFILTLMLLGVTNSFSQIDLAQAQTLQTEQARYGDVSGFAVLHYQINVAPTLEKPYLKGEVTGEFLATKEGLSSLTLDLADALKVSEVAGGADYKQADNKLTIRFATPKTMGEKFVLRIVYEGEPSLAVNGNISKGLRWENHGAAKDQRIIANLSTPFLAHLWYPCKDGPSGKIQNGVNVNITVPDLEVAGIPVVGVSNGLLREVVKKDGKVTYKWEHNYPIVPYYVMMAVSNYRKLQQDYTDPYGNKFPLEYYVFDEHVADAQKGTADMPKVMDFFSTVFGEYPYAKEKYGMTQLGFYSGIENQTNVIVNNMAPIKFYTSVHELAHMWFADAITCGTWQHGWLNEGFASYAEALWDEHANGKAKYIENMLGSTYFDSGTLLLPPTDNPFKVFVPSIYNKGQWVVHSLRGVMGDVAFFKALKSYAQDPRFKHRFALTEDLQAVCERESGKNLQSFFQQWVYGENYPVYATNYTQNAKTKTVSLRIDQKKWDTKPNFFTMPIEVRLTFADGSTQIERVENTQLSQTFELKASKQLTNITLDPNEWILKQTGAQTFVKGTKKMFEVNTLGATATSLKLLLLSAKSQTIEVYIYAADKKEMMHQTVKKVKGDFAQTLTLNTPLPAGRYDVVLKGADTEITKSIVIEKAR